MVNYIRISLYIFLFSTIGWAQKNADELPHEIASKWFQLQVEMIPNTDGFTPPVTARVMGYTGLTLYESIVHGSSKYETLAGKLNELEKLPKPKNLSLMNWALVANKAQAEIMAQLYAKNSTVNSAKIDRLYKRLFQKYSRGSSPDEIKASLKFAETLADAIYNYSKSDGGHEAYKNNFPKDYDLEKGNCAWIPVGNQEALQPYWGSNRTFVKGSSDFDMPPPPMCQIGNSSILYVQALEVYSVGKNLTQEQKEIAEFWSDDPGKTFTPPGHGASITNQLVIKENLSLSEAAEVYARVGIAANDAFISCWKCKYKYNLLRPVTFIKTTIDPSWNAYLPNPPFPEYTSGHGTVSAAIAIVLSDKFGYNYPFTDYSHEKNGMKPRSFDSFFAYAQEAALSRLYGGIHYRISNERGFKNGKMVGQKICELEMKKSDS